MWKEIVAKAQVLIKFAETLKDKTGPEKKAIVVSGMCKAINIPFVPDWLEGLIEPPFYGFIVDWAFGLWKYLTGNNLDLIPDDDEKAAGMAEIIKAELKSAAAGDPSRPAEVVGELAGDTVDEKFNSLLERYAVK